MNETTCRSFVWSTMRRQPSDGHRLGGRAMLVDAGLTLAEALRAGHHVSANLKGRGGINRGCTSNGVRIKSLQRYQTS
jgi:hypothetical protein